MNRLIFCLLLGLSLPTFAQQAAPAAETSATQRPSPKTFNFTMNPGAAYLGAVDASAQFRIAEHWTLGPAIQIWNLKLIDIEWAVSTFGVQAVWTYNSALTDGPFILGAVETGSASASITSSASGTSTRYTTKSTMSFAQLGAGYVWYFQNFNVALGVAATGMSVTTLRPDPNQDAGTVPLNSGLLVNLGFAL